MPSKELVKWWQKYRELKNELSIRYNSIIQGHDVDERYLTNTLSIAQSMIWLINIHIQNQWGVAQSWTYQKQEIKRVQSAILQMLGTIKYDPRDKSLKAANGAANFPNMKGVSVRRTQSQASMPLGNPYVFCIDDARLKVRN